jgi:ferrochelatase
MKRVPPGLECHAVDFLTIQRSTLSRHIGPSRVDMTATPDTKYFRPVGHPDVRSGRVGVLLVNLGTPDATDYWSMRRYLRQFLSDRRVIEVNRAVWWAVLNLIILTTRPGRKGRDYDKIWNMERNESPLKTITRAQAEKLDAMLASNSARPVVDWAMRYGNPSIASRLDALMAQGCDRILIAPLYPQYAAATSATVFDEAARALGGMRWQPSLRILPPYYDTPAYIDAIAGSLQAGLSKLSFTPEVVVASFHGMPEEYLEKGDPYYCQCAKTARLLREKLGLSDDKLMMTFQSRFGSAEWLKPYTDATMKTLAEHGVKDVAVITPGFAADCLETLEEIAMENASIFKEAGGRNFAFIPSLNDSDAGMRMIHALVSNELKGWL